MSTFGKRLKKLRELKMLSQAKLSEELGFSAGLVGMWETGKRMPSYEAQEIIADYFNVSLDYLTGRSDVSMYYLNPSNLLVQENAFNYKVKIPVRGMVHAGVPTEAFDDILDWEEITPDMAAKGDLMALKVNGDCMEPKFSDGDVVIVLCRSDCDSGDIAIVMVNGNEAEMKKVKKFEDGSINLISTNPAYPVRSYTAKEIETLPLKILGKVIELRAKF